MRREFVSERLMLFDLTLPRDGFHHFISTWLLCLGERAILVDPGPARSIPALVNALEEQGVTSLEGVILTHIHMDHAGGIGDLVQALPTEWILAHPMAHKHLVDPTRLWEGSQKVLGDLTALYGPITPVPASLLRFEEALDVGEDTLLVLETPGHAPHHISIACEEGLFTGEAVGVVFPLGGSHDALYLRPATPPRFRPETFLQSIRALRGLPSLPKRVCYGHYGWRDETATWLQRGEEQTLRWVDIISQHSDEDVEALFERLLEEDPWFAPFRLLPADVQKRERYFVSNSIKGMLRMER